MNDRMNDAVTRKCYKHSKKMYHVQTLGPGYFVYQALAWIPPGFQKKRRHWTKTSWSEATELVEDRQKPICLMSCQSSRRIKMRS